MMTDIDRFSGYVLAGGKSLRMGSDKAFLPFRDSNFLHLAMRTLAEATGHPSKVVVSDFKRNLFTESLPAESIVTDVFEDRGALGGIHAALADTETHFCVVLAVDLPLVTTESVGILMDAVVRDGSDAVVIEQHDGRLQPLFGVYRTETCLPLLENLIKVHGDLSVRDLLARIRTSTVSQSDISSNPEFLINVNDRTSYANLLQQ